MTRGLRRLVGLGAVVVVAAALALTTSPAAQASVPPEPGDGQQVAPELAAGRTVAFGAATPDLASLTQLEQAVDHRAARYLYYRNWAVDRDFDAAFASRVRARGAVPEITWEPWDPSRGATQPAYTLDRISSGAYDAYVRRWAQQVKAWGSPLVIRFAHEMNGTWYPWAEGANGNDPGDYVAAWRHVHQVFDAVGADNVIWSWSPNVQYTGSRPLPGLYPGDALVDEVAVDGYNGGTALDFGGWKSFTTIFTPTLNAVRRLSDRPLAIGEVASAEAGGSKATWIRGFFDALADNPDIVAFNWFDYDKETDWRVQSSPAARRAFAAGLTDPRYS